MSDNIDQSHQQQQQQQPQHHFNNRHMLDTTREKIHTAQQEYLPPSAQEVLAKTNELLSPYKGKVAETKDSMKYYLEIAQAHSGRIKPLLNRHYATIEANAHQLLIPFHQKRKQYPWEMVAGATATVALCSMPFGAFRTAKNAGVAWLVATAVVNPEMLYDWKQQYMKKGELSNDETNKQQFRY